MTPTPYHDAVTTQRDEWAQQLTDVRTKIATLTDELTRLQQGALALDGAVTAADLLLQRFASLDADTDTNTPSV